MHFIEWSYFIYLAISLVVTVWVARTLYKRGRVFLVDSFQGDKELADSINHLLVVGFYLVNIGFVGLALRSEGNLVNLRQAIEMLSAKLGWVLVILGGMHFMNIYIFSRFRDRHLPRTTPPLSPTARITPPPTPGGSTPTSGPITDYLR
jgi:hypothetical protein